MVRTYSKPSHTFSRGFQKSVPERIKYVLGRAAAKGKLEHVSLTDRNRVVAAVTKVLNKNGKAAASVKLLKLQKILNRCAAIGSNFVDKGELNSIEQALNITKKVTSKIDTELPVILKAEQRQPKKDKKQKALEIKKGQTVTPNGKKEFNRAEFNKNLDLRVKQRQEMLAKLAEANNRINGGKPSLSEAGAKVDPKKNVSGKPQSSNLSEKGSENHKSGGKPHEKTALTNPARLYTFRGIGSLNNKYDQDDLKYGGINSNTSDESKFLIMQKALHRIPIDTDSRYGGQGSEAANKAYKDDITTKKTPEWNVEGKWSVQDKLEAMGDTDPLNDAGTDSSPKGPDSPETSPTP